MTDVSALVKTMTPMLAESKSEVPLATLAGTHLFDEKLDGLRALIGIGDEVVIRNRNGRIMTTQFPELELPCLDLPKGLILDGEITTLSGRFEEANNRSRLKPFDVPRGAERAPAVFTAFDVLHAPGFGDTRHLPYRERRAALETLPLYGSLSRTMCSEDPHFFTQITTLGGEGVIAKRLDAPYRSGRQRTWLKYKGLTTVSCLAIGFDGGHGSREDMGAVRIAMWNPEGASLHAVGSVGSGFSPQTATAMRHLIMSAADRIPELGVRALPIIEVECLGQTSGGKLRHPVFKGVRGDLTYLDCSISQMTDLPSS